MAKKNKLFLRNQSGAALVIALIILVVLTLISLSSSITSISEIKLSGNKRGSTDAFYTADGGIQATIANLANFNSSSADYVLIADTGGISRDIINQSVDKRLPTDKVTFAPGVQWSTLTSAPTVVIYHQTTTGAPRGVPFSAAGNVGFEYYVINSIGAESLGSRSEVVTTAVRIMPSSQGGSGSGP
jgi:Tfp pilus assembly protein PilX